jgi:hypothetical protein
MTTEQYESLKKKLEAEKTAVAENKGRLQQLKDTAKATFKVDSISELQKLKEKKETELDMQRTKKNIQIEKLKSIVPTEVMREINEL